MSRTLFISDLHLDAASPQRLAAFTTFLDNATDCDALYILGDLYDTWIGDDDDSTLATASTAALRAFSEKGPKLYLQRGNRDFLLGPAFFQRTGAQPLPDAALIDLYSRPTLLLHGDTLCTGDHDYQALRKKLRDPRWQAATLRQSLEERRTLAEQLRSLSSEATSNKAEDIMDVTPSEVERVMAEHGVTQLIHGHTHRPGHHRETYGERWVLGDWNLCGWVIEATWGEIRLDNFFI